MIGAEQAIFERSAIKAADDQIHLFRIGCVDERETLRFLRFGVADHFDVVENQVLCVQPGFDIVLRDPNRQIAEEDGKTHS